MLMEITERILEGLRARTVSYGQLFKGENTDWSSFGEYIPNPDEAHQFGECMEDWHDYAWRKKQEEMDCRKKELN